MFKRTACSIIIVSFLFAIPSFATLLDTPSPYWSQNHPLGRNPARAAYLKKKNRLNLSYTLSTQINYTDNYSKSIEDSYLYYKGIRAETPNPYTNSYFSSAIPLFSDNIYISFDYINNASSRRDAYIPSKNVELPFNIVAGNYIDHSYNEIFGGVGLSFSLANNMIFLGLQAQQGNDYSEEYHYDHYIYPGVTDHDYMLESIQSEQYYVYSVGALLPTNLFTLALSQTITTPKYLTYENKYRDFVSPENNTYRKEYFWNYYPPITSIGLLFTNKSIEWGLSSEFYGYGEIYDLSIHEQNHLMTKPFTRYSLGIEMPFSPFFSVRGFGSVTPGKDARLNYNDWGLLRDKRSYTPANDDSSGGSWGDLDGQNIFNEEEFGLDLEFLFADTVALTLGANKKNYIFEGRRPPYGIALAVEDIRGYAGLSIIGIFQGDDKKAEKKEPEDKAAPEKPEEKKLPDRDTENRIIPKVGEPDQYTSFKEEVYVSARNVFPGDNVIVSVREGTNPMFKGSVGYATTTQEYRYPLYESSDKVWKATVPISPTTPPGSYTLKLNKIYDDTSLEVSSFTITVKELPKTAQ